MSLRCYKWVSGTILRIVYLGLEVDRGGHGGDIPCRWIVGSCHRVLFVVRSYLQLRNLIWTTHGLYDLIFPSTLVPLWDFPFSWFTDNWGSTWDYWYVYIIWGWLTVKLTLQVYHSVSDNPAGRCYFIYFNLPAQVSFTQNPLSPLKFCQSLSANSESAQS